jgi:hypothetical protein
LTDIGDDCIHCYSTCEWKQSLHLAIKSLADHNFEDIYGSWPSTMIAEVKDKISLAEKTCAMMGAGRAHDPAVVGFSSKDYGAAGGCVQSPT